MTATSFHVLIMVLTGVHTDMLEKVLERLATTEKSTTVIERQPDGKMRVTSGSWDCEKVFSRDQVLEVRNVEGCIHVARKPRRTTNGTRRSRSMTHTGPATNSSTTDVSDR
jgi:hypothetical protein